MLTSWLNRYSCHAQHPLTTVVLSVKLAEGVAELLAAAKKQQGQYTEAVVTTHCIIHWAHASVLRAGAYEEHECVLTLTASEERAAAGLLLRAISTISKGSSTWYRGNGKCIQCQQNTMFTTYALTTLFSQ